MTLIDDTCDQCGGRFDPMGDPLLHRRPDDPVFGEWAVYCDPCEQEYWRRAEAGMARPDRAPRPSLRSRLTGWVRR